MAGGAPTKYRPEHCDTVREMVLNGATDGEIAATLEVARSTVSLWKSAHPEFSDALKAWKGEADDAVESSLYRKALSGDVTACIFWLKNRRSAEWRDKHDVAVGMSEDWVAMLAARRVQAEPQA